MQRLWIQTIFNLLYYALLINNNRWLKDDKETNFSVSPIFHQFIIIIIVKTYHFNKRFVFLSLMQFQKHNRTRKTRTKMQKWLLLSFVLHPLFCLGTQKFLLFSGKSRKCIPSLVFFYDCIAKCDEIGLSFIITKKKKKGKKLYICATYYC